jgi:hypothetical protein
VAIQNIPAYIGELSLQVRSAGWVFGIMTRLRDEAAGRIHTLEGKYCCEYCATPMDRHFMHVQAFMTPVGVVSRFLWPPSNSGSRGRDRGAELRALLEMDGTSILADRSLRNRLEHVDELMDREDAVSEMTYGFFLYHGSLEEFRNTEGRSLDNTSHRFYHTSTLHLTWWGETYNLVAISAAMDEVSESIGRLRRNRPELVPW